MDSTVTVVLTNEQGWQKRYPLEEGVYVVGSAADARIRLPAGEGIAPYHIQLVNSAREACMRLVNLSEWVLPVKSGAQDVRVEPGQLRDVFDGETIFLDALAIQFEIHKHPVQTAIIQEENRNVIGLRMVLSGQVLYPGGTLTGTLYLRNLGTEACQFDIELDGLPPDCYEISPPALIHAGGEESTEIHFFHRKTTPAPGAHTFDLRVSAPNTYPGRDLIIRQSLKVMPCYDYQFGFDLPDEQGIELEQSADAVVETLEAAPAPLSIEPVKPSLFAPPEPPQDPFAGIWAEEPDKPEESIPEDTGLKEPERVVLPSSRTKRPDLSGVKVMKASTGEFLEEKDKRP